MKLYSIYTDEAEVLKDIFLKSLKDDWEINISYWGKIGEGGGDTWTPGWYDILREKIEFLVDKIKQNWGEIIIWSDIDIQFFGKCSDLINKTIVDKDIIFLSWHWPDKQINGGFFVMHCNDKTLSFFELVLQSRIEKLQFGEQTAINDLLKDNPVGIKWDVLPRQFWAAMAGEEPPADIVLHHAVGTYPTVKNGKKVGSIELKIKQMEQVRKYVRWRWFLSIKSTIKRFMRNRLSVIYRRLT